MLVQVRPFAPPRASSLMVKQRTHNPLSRSSILRGPTRFNSLALLVSSGLVRIMDNTEDFYSSNVGSIPARGTTQGEGQHVSTQSSVRCGQRISSSWRRDPGDSTRQVRLCRRSNTISVGSTQKEQSCCGTQATKDQVNFG